MREMRFFMSKSIDNSFIATDLPTITYNNLSSSSSSAPVFARERLPEATRNKKRKKSSLFDRSRRGAL